MGHILIAPLAKTGMAVATPLSLEDAIDVLEAKFVDNG